MTTHAARGKSARRWILTGTAAALWMSPAGAQETQPAVPSVTDSGEMQDSGVGDLDTQSWIGKPVMSSDGREIGQLTEVEMASDTADAGILKVQREGGTVNVPLAGASFDGSKVTVAPLYDAAVAD